MRAAARSFTRVDKNLLALKVSSEVASSNPPWNFYPRSAFNVTLSNGEMKLGVVLIDLYLNKILNNIDRGSDLLNLKCMNGWMDYVCQ